MSLWLQEDRIHDGRNIWGRHGGWKRELRAPILNFKQKVEKRELEMMGRIDTSNSAPGDILSILPIPIQRTLPIGNQPPKPMGETVIEATALLMIAKKKNNQIQRH